MKTKRILVVDDNRSVVKALELVLKHAGFEVITAFDGPEALEKAFAKKPDLVILDIEMPTMDGYEVCRQLRAARALEDLRIIMLTMKGRVANLGPQLNVKKVLQQRVLEQTEGFQAGADEFLSKPIVAREVVAHVKRLLGMS
jgi:DNA-binding response OmpR family regulator